MPTACRDCVRPWATSSAWLYCQTVRWCSKPRERRQSAALGSNSSARQRAAAINLTHYITNAMVQRNLSLRSLAFLPVNPNVDISDPLHHPDDAGGSQNAATQHEADLAGLVHQADRSSATTPTLIPLIFGASNPQSGADALVRACKADHE